MLTDGYSLRELTVRDAAAFRSLRLIALKEVSEAFGTSYAEEKVKTLRNYQRDLGRSRKSKNDFIIGIFVADGDGELVAIAGFYRNKKVKTNHKGLMWGMFVRADHRRKGLASHLLKNALDRVRSLQSVEVLLINVVTSNHAAIQLYERFGFKTYGHEEKAFKLEGNYHDVLHMNYSVG